MRRAAKVDLNHGEIVAALRKIGCRVLSLAAIGKGCPDLLVHFRRQMFLVECKSKDGKLTKAQEEFHWQWPVIVAYSAEEACAEIIRRGE